MVAPHGLGELRPEDALHRGPGRVHHRDVVAEYPQCRGDLASDESPADHNDAARPGERGAQLHAVLDGAQHMAPAIRAGYRQPPRPQAGGDDESVVIRTACVAVEEPLRSEVRSHDRGAQAEVDIADGGSAAKGQRTGKITG